VAESRRSRWLSRLQNRLLLAAAVGLVGGLALPAAAAALEAHLNSWLCVGIGVAGAVLIQLVRETAAEPQAVEFPLQRIVADRSEYFARLRQLEHRLEATSWDGSKYDRNVRPVLARLAAERLRQKYGIDVQRQPQRAREVLGDQLWSLMVDIQTASPPQSQARLSALVAAIEAL
jgi:hypothetical protein